MHVDTGVPNGAALLALTDAAALRDEHELPIARQAAIDALGSAAVLEAIGAAAAFAMMNRIMETLGATIDDAQGLLARVGASG